MEVKINEEVMDTKTGQDEEKIVNLTLVPESNVSRQELVYACQFYVSPEFRKYYYVPDPAVVAMAGDKVVLYTVPAFPGAFGSEWQVGICLHHWVEVTRWVSLYMTRVDESSAYSAPIQLQCEFRIVDGTRTALHSQQSMFTVTMPGDIGGFSQFVPFKQALKMMSPEGYLHVEAHMMLILETSLTQIMPTTSEEVKSPQVIESTKSAKSGEKEPSSEASSSAEVNDHFVVSNSVEKYESERPSFFPNVIEKNATVLFSLDGEIVGAADRDKLLELSQHYKNCVDSNLSQYWDQMEFRRPGLSPSMSYINWMTIHQYLQFVEDHGADICCMGTFEDSRQLFEVANKMETMDLMEHCVHGMCTRVTLKEAPLLVSFFKEYPDMIKACWSDSVHEFRKFFQKNFKAIQSDPVLRDLMNFEKKHFTKFLLHPDLEFADDDEDSDTVDGDDNNQDAASNNDNNDAIEED